MQLSVLTVLTAAAILFAGPAHTDPPVDSDGDSGAFSCASVECVDRMIEYQIRVAPRHPMANPAKRRQLARLILAAAQRYDLPAAVVVAIVYRESSFRTEARGYSAQEIGLMQIHPLTAVRFRCKLVTAAEQLDCGCRILRHHYDKCGTLEGGLTVYGSRYNRCEARKGTRLHAMVSDRMALARQLDKAVSDGS